MAVASSVAGTVSVRPFPIHDAAFTAVSSLTSNAWTGEVFRRIDVNLRIQAGTAGDVSVTGTGLSAATYYTTQGGFANASIGLWDAANNAGANAWVLKAANLPTNIKFGGYITADGGTAYRSLVGGHSMDANAKQEIFSMFSLDVSHSITSLAFAFAGGACTGWLNIVGYP